MNLDFGDIFTRAWRITWNNKGLWILGVFVALASGGGGGSGSNFNTDFSSGGPSGNFPNIERFFSRFVEQQAGPLIALTIGLVCLGLLLSLIFFVLGLIGRGGLIGGARLAQANGRVTFGEAFAEGRHHWGKLFVLWLITGLPMLILTVALAVIGIAVFISLVSAGRGSEEAVIATILGSLVCIIPLACGLGLVGIVLQILNHMGTLAAVSEDISGMAALQRGWTVFRNNLVSLLVLGIILIVLGGVFNFVLTLPIFLAVIPVFIGMAAGFANDSPAALGGGVLFAIVCCLAYSPILLVLQGIFETWALSAWSLAYAKLTGPAPVATPFAPPQLDPMQG